MHRRGRNRHPDDGTAPARALRTAWRAALALLLLVAAGTAQRRVTVQNLTPFARTEWTSVVVPFAKGTVDELPDLHVRDCPTVWQPFGARWNDGSLRQAICCFHTSVDGQQLVELELDAGTGPALPDTTFALPPHRLQVVAEIDGELHLGDLVPSELLEQNAARQVVVLRCRVGDSGLVVEAPLTVWAGQEHGELGLGVFFSDPARPRMQVAITELVFVTQGLGWFPRHGRPQAVNSQPTRLGTRHVLLRNVTLGDGQGIRRVGALLPPLSGGDDETAQRRDDTLKAASLAPLWSATEWQQSGSFGAFGHVPEPPPWMPDPRSVRVAANRRHAEFLNWSKTTKPDPLHGPVLGPAKVPGQAGEQADFGQVGCEPVASHGLPSYLHEVEFSVLQEGCRPVHNFEDDATPVLSSRHPGWVVWDGVTHWHCGVSTDRLGKPCPRPRYETNGWKGKDREHWSTNYMGSFALLTASPSAVLEMRNETQLYLAAQTLQKDLWTSKPGVARAAGRTMLAATWLYLVTGDGELLARMRARMLESNYANWSGRDLPEGKIRPFNVRGTDARTFPDHQGESWSPWEESQTVIGFAAYLALTEDQDPRLREMVDALALTLLRDCWQEHPGYGAQLAYAMVWKGGEPMTDAEREDRGKVMWPSAGFGVWGMGALHVARDAALRRGETELAAKAARYLELLAEKRVNDGGWYDRYSQFDGVRISDRSARQD